MFDMFLRRAIAFVVDVIILILIFFGNFMFMVTSLNLSAENPMNLVEMMMMVALQLLYVMIYFIYIPIKWPGQTVGKKLLKIKEVTQNGRELTLKQYFQRDFLLKFLLSSMTSGFAVLFNAILLTYQLIRKQELRALHDIIVKTKVVRIK
ncbi:MAG: RDD family protein [Turicibacter sp.]|nr:RDD family protein [Turicibacter sp.]MDO5794557.1 RDD family protein [Turicibacter sp.]